MGGIAVAREREEPPRARIGLEPWDSIWPDAKDLAEAHHNAVGAPWPHTLDERTFEAMYGAGVLKILAARSAGVLRGYCLWYLAPNLESAGMLVAQQGPWFALDPGLGLRLLRESYRLMPEWGVEYALPHHWANEPRLGLLFRRFGDVPLETVYLHKVRAFGPQED